MQEALLSDHGGVVPLRASGEKEKKASKVLVGFVFLLFVVLRSMDRVFNKRVQDRMVNYQLMYMNVLWPIGVQGESE